MARRAAALLILVGVLVSAPGCARGEVLDGERTADTVRLRLEATYGVDVEEVSCPHEVEVDDGGEFRCRARVGNSVIDVEVVQTDGRGTLQIAAEAALLSTPAVEADVASVLADRFGRDEVEVTCEGPEVRVEEPDATFTCEAIDGDETEQVEVRVHDASGALTYALGDE